MTSENKRNLFLLFSYPVSRFASIFPTQWKDRSDSACRVQFFRRKLEVKLILLAKIVVSSHRDPISQGATPKLFANLIVFDSAAWFAFKASNLRLIPLPMGT